MSGKLIEIGVGGGSQTAAEIKKIYNEAIKGAMDHGKSINETIKATKEQLDFLKKQTKELENHKQILKELEPYYAKLARLSALSHGNELKSGNFFASTSTPVSLEQAKREILSLVQQGHDKVPKSLQALVNNDFTSAEQLGKIQPYKKFVKDLGKDFTSSPEELISKLTTGVGGLSGGEKSKSNKNPADAFEDFGNQADKNAQGIIDAINKNGGVNSEKILSSSKESLIKSRKSGGSGGGGNLSPEQELEQRINNEQGGGGGGGENKSLLDYIKLGAKAMGVYAIASTASHLIEGLSSAQTGQDYLYNLPNADPTGIVKMLMAFTGNNI